MTPSLALAYDSAAAQRDSPVGLGWSFAVRAISRSTREGFPSVRAGSRPFTFTYDEEGAYTAPTGELVRATADVKGPPGEGELFAPLRETSPVRYRKVGVEPSWFSSSLSFLSGWLPDWAEGTGISFPLPGFWFAPPREESRWEEHEPSGLKRYYGVDPFTGAEAKLVNELGEAEWLLLREEDPFGNAITYEYHDLEDQDRAGADLARAQKLPVLKRVAWGQNRVTGVGEQFAVETSVAPKSGPLDLLHGGTLLTSKLTSLRVRPVGGTPYWTYELGYETSPTTGRERLASVERVDHGPGTPVRRVTRFAYGERDGAGTEKGPAVFDGSWRAVSTALASAYTIDLKHAPLVGASRGSMEGAMNAHGFRAATKFLDYDGDGRSDILYHGAGLHVPQAQLVPEWSRLACAASGTCAPGTEGFPSQRASDLADLDGDGDVDPISYPEQVRICWPATTLIDRTAPALRVGGLTPVEMIETNSTRSSGVALPSMGFLQDWPAAASREVTVALGESRFDPDGDGARVLTHDVFQSTVDSDFTAPVVDLTADGRPDIALLKTFSLTANALRRNDNCMSPGGGSAMVGVFGFFADAPRALLARVSSGLAERLSALPPERASSSLLEFLRARFSRPVADELAARPLYATPPESLHRELMAEAFASLGNELPSFGSVQVLRGGSDLGGLGELFDGGGMPNPETGYPGRWGADMLGPGYFDGNGIRFPWEERGPGDSAGDREPGGGSGEQFPLRFDFLPRVYLARGASELAYVLDREGFSTSLLRATYTGWPGPEGGSVSMPDCWADAWGIHCRRRGGSAAPEPAYVSQADFNSFFLDVNSDSLPDLVLAEPPTKSDSLTLCNPGHRVLINRGYRFEWREPGDVARRDWRDSPLPQEHWSDALMTVRNRGGWCAGGQASTKYLDVPVGGLSFNPTALDPDSWGVPMAAVSPVDLDADGRGDLVIAYDVRDPSVTPTSRDYSTRRVRRVLRNTGRGFEELPASRVAALLPQDFRLADMVNLITGLSPEKENGYIPNPFDVGEAAKLQLIAADAGRLVDMDSDGLVDLVEPGVRECSLKRNASPGDLETCTTKRSARWLRNAGAVPDLLTRIDTTLGAFTEVEYQPALTSAAVKYPARGLRPPPSMRLATKVRSRSVPETSTLLGAPPAKVVTLEYENFVRDPASHEQLGFETVRARFQNSFAGARAETVTVEQRYDVRAALPGLALRHPLKGALLETVTRSSDAPDTFRSTTERSVSALGQGVRIRPRAVFREHCVPGDCRTTGTEVLEFDEHGYATRTLEGDAVAATVSEDDALETLLDFQHDAERWQLGLPAHETTMGNRSAFDGSVTRDVLNEVARTFTDEGLISTEQRPGFQASGCEGAGTEDLIRYWYTKEGLLDRTEFTARGRVDKLVYGGDRLYPGVKRTTVTRYLDGRAVGTTKLSFQYGFDRRTGAPTKVTDPNRVTQTTTRDSLGRELSVSLAAPELSAVTLRTTRYEDDTSPVADTVTYRQPGVATTTRTHLDGAGNVLGVVDTADGVAIRRKHARFDAFGRVVVAALPARAVSLDDYAVAADTRFVTTVTDGFNRAVSLTKPDGTTTAFTHGPRWTREVNARGFVTKRETDWRGKLTRVERLGDGVDAATHSLTRDGLGRLAAIVDADGNIRRYERDRGGRLRFASLPHAPSATPLRFEYCFDGGDALVAATTPEGRVTVLEVDELGRVVSTTSTGENSSAVTSTRSYDEPAAANGLGRLTRLVDDAGTTETTYDAFGRLAEVRRTLPEPFFDGAGSEQAPRDFEARFSRDFLGNLESVSLSAPGAFGGESLALTYARDSRGRTTRLTSGSGTTPTELVGSIRFDEAERLIGAKFGSGVTGSWAYEHVTQHLTAISYAHGSAAVASVVYSDYDPMGNLEHEQRFDGNGELLSEKLHRYDALDRLANSELWHPLGNKGETFAYTPAGNLRTAGADTYAYAEPSLPQAATSVNASGRSRELSYDADGNLLTDVATDQAVRTHGLEGAHDRALTWNAAGCLTSVVAADDADGAATTRLICDSAGSSVARRTTTARGTTSRFDLSGIGELRLEEGIFLLRLPVGGTVQVEDAWSLETGDRVVEKSGYLFSDARGSVLAKTSFGAKGAVILEQAEYDAWGATARISELAAPQHQFTGIEPDPGLGLYHFGVRAYDPTLRRWLSPDPLFLASPEGDEALGAQLNLYGYAGNNPVALIDSAGERIQVADTAQRGIVMAAMQQITGFPLMLDALGYVARAEGPPSADTPEGAQLVFDMIASQRTAWVVGFVGAKAVNESETRTLDPHPTAPRPPSDSVVQLDVRENAYAYVGDAAARKATGVEKMPLYLILTHELAHARDFASGTVTEGYVTGRTFTRPDGSEKEEVRFHAAELEAMRVENAVRCEHGRPERAAYTGATKEDVARYKQ